MHKAGLRKIFRKMPVSGMCSGDLCVTSYIHWKYMLPCGYLKRGGIVCIPYILGPNLGYIMKIISSQVLNSVNPMCHVLRQLIRPNKNNKHYLQCLFAMCYKAEFSYETTEAD